MKIVWVSVAPWVGTGYGQQTAQVTSRLKAAGHDVAIVAVNGLDGSTMTYDGMTVYPTDHSHVAKKMLRPYAEHHGGGSLDDVLVITLHDTWVFAAPEFGGLLDTTGMNIASWTPVDHDPLPPRVAHALEKTGSRPIAMSKFGKEQLNLVFPDALYVPHAIDTNVFKPHGGRDAFRAALKLPQDAFVVGMVANNSGSAPPRKAFPQMFQAFAEFRRRHDDAILYLHTNVAGDYEGINLVAIAEITGIPSKAMCATDQFKYHIGLEPEVLARMYENFDVLANPSYGEGFGIPIIEAQACGTPVIVTDWTAMPELCGAGWKVEGDRWYDPSQGSFYMCPNVYSILDALEEAYAARGDQELRDKAREFALGYDADKVFDEYWLPAIDELSRPREVAPLAVANGNRAQRRAKKKQAA